MLFCVNFGTHHEFDRRRIYNNLLFFPSKHLRDSMCNEKGKAIKEDSPLVRS